MKWRVEGGGEGGVEGRRRSRVAAPGLAMVRPGHLLGILTVSTWPTNQPKAATDPHTHNNADIDSGTDADNGAHTDNDADFCADTKTEA